MEKSYTLQRGLSHISCNICRILNRRVELKKIVRGKKNLVLLNSFKMIDEISKGGWISYFVGDSRIIANKIKVMK